MDSCTSSLLSSSWKDSPPTPIENFFKPLHWYAVWGCQFSTEFLQTVTPVCCIWVPIQHRISLNHYTSVLVWDAKLVKILLKPLDLCAMQGTNSVQILFKLRHQCALLRVLIQPVTCQTIAPVCHARYQFSVDFHQTITLVSWWQFSLDSL